MITPPFGCCEGAGADSSDLGWNRLKYTKRDFPMRAPRKRSRCHHGRFRALPTIEPRRQAATLRVSRSADCENGCFLMMFQSHSAARSKKVDIQQRITFADLCLRAFDNAQIDIHAGEVHDGVWCSPFALVLALDFLPKKTTAIPSLEGLFEGLVRHRTGERFLRQRAVARHVMMMHCRSPQPAPQSKWRLQPMGG